MKKSDLQVIKEFLKTPRGKAIAFFGVYFVFFVILSIVSRTNLVNGDRVYEAGSPVQFDMESITNNNYKFTYNIDVDGSVITYTGIRNDTKESMTCCDMKEFYSENGNYFTNSSGIWIKTTNPYLYNSFYNTSNLSSLIDTATYVSKTEYESGKGVYNFSVSSATINKLFENVDLDIEEVPNEIIISTDENNYVNEIKFKLDSYCKAKKICVNSMSITLNYELYGEIEEITSPLE